MAGSKKEIGTGFITEVDRYLFNNGRHYEIFEKMGAHPKIRAKTAYILPSGHLMRNRSVSSATLTAGIRRQMR